MPFIFRNRPLCRGCGLFQRPRLAGGFHVLARFEALGANSDASDAAVVKDSDVLKIRPVFAFDLGSDLAADSAEVLCKTPAADRVTDLGAFTAHFAYARHILSFQS
jgi:hypothetical protein